MSHARVAVVVQARTSSRRLPGKVLLPLAGEPAIVRMLERVARVRRADRLVLATSFDPSDDALAETVAARGYEVVRGPLDDVLARFVAAVPPGFDTVVRLTGDCPLVDPELVDRHIEIFAQEQPKAEYVTNAVVRSWPDGLDVEVVGRALLERAHAEACRPEDREHVLPWVRRHATLRAVTRADGCSGDPSVDLSALRWTLDTRADYETIAAIYDALHPLDPAFGSDSVYDLLVKRPHLIHLAGGASPGPAERDAWVERIRAARGHAAGTER